MPVRYEFDELNRLVVTDPRTAARVQRVVEGRVTVDRRNRLHYLSATKPASRESDLTLDGTWTLSPRHEVGLLLHPSERDDRQAVFLRGSVSDVSKNALTLSLAHAARNGRRTSQRVELAGRWQADERNRLTFLAAKSGGSEDRLVFDGAWDVDAAGRLSYRYELPRAGRAPAVQTLRFAGVWDLRPPGPPGNPRAGAGNARVAYQLAGSSRSAFEFEAALQSPTLNAADGRIAYQAGIRLSDGRTVTRTIVLFGAWKLSRALSATFELSAPQGRGRRVTFQGQAAVSSRNTITVQLAGEDGRPLGAAVTFSRSFLKRDAQWFVRLQREGDDTRLLGGVHIRF